MPIPIPIVLAALAGASAIAGVIKGVEAKDTYDRAQSYIDDARRLADNVKSRSEEAKDKLQKNLELLGQAKLRLTKVSGQVADELAQDALKKSAYGKITPVIGVQTVYQFSSKISDVASSLVGALGFGAASCAIALGGVIAFGTASTGTAIGALSGAAFSSALLAWFGGGALAVGGLGTLGGAAILSGLFAGPALLIGGFILSSKADDALDEARAKYRQVKEQTEQVEVLIQAMNSGAQKIVPYSDLFDRTAKSLEQMLEQYKADKDRNFGLRAAMECLLVYNNIINSNLQLFDPDEDVNHPKFKLNQKFKLLGQYLEESLNEFERLNKATGDDSCSSLPALPSSR